MLPGKMRNCFDGSFIEVDVNSGVVHCVLVFSLQVLKDGLHVKCVKYKGCVYKIHVPKGLSQYKPGQEVQYMTAVA